MPKKIYNITVPVAGHCIVSVEAESGEEALELALDICGIDNLDTWEPVRHFSRGNVCYCPQPWNITIDSIEELDE